MYVYERRQRSGCGHKNNYYVSMCLCHSSAINVSGIFSDTFINVSGVNLHCISLTTAC